MMKNLIVLTILFSMIKFGSLAQEKVEGFSGVFAMETCNHDNFSVCFDGIEQTYRNHFLYMVKLKSHDILANYDTVFSFDSIFVHTDEIDSIEEVLKMNSNDVNSCLFFDRGLRRNVNRYYRRNRKQKKFDGNLKYFLFRMEFDAFYSGSETVPVPFNKKTKKRAVIEIKSLPKYTILHIKSVEPIDCTDGISNVLFSKNSRLR